MVSNSIKDSTLGSLLGIVLFQLDTRVNLSELNEGDHRLPSSVILTNLLEINNPCHLFAAFYFLTAKQNHTLNKLRKSIKILLLCCVAAIYEQHPSTNNINIALLIAMIN